MNYICRLFFSHRTIIFTGTLLGFYATANTKLSGAPPELVKTSKADAR